MARKAFRHTKVDRRIQHSLHLQGSELATQIFLQHNSDFVPIFLETRKQHLLIIVYDRV